MIANLLIFIVVGLLALLVLRLNGEFTTVIFKIHESLQAAWNANRQI